MAKFRIQPHGRLQEWVAEELGYFKDEGLDYEFVFGIVSQQSEKPKEVRHGALEDMKDGRACDVSSACHWMVNVAATGQHGRMWGHAYSVTPSGIFVPPESEIRKPRDLANVEIAVGYHSGSHFSALQARGADPRLFGGQAAVRRPAAGPHGPAAGTRRSGRQRFRRAHVCAGAAGVPEDRRYHLHDRLPAGAGRRRRRHQEVLRRAATRPARHRHGAGTLPALSPPGDSRALPRAGGRQRHGSRRAHGL